jgi:hypothetical protein
MEGDAMKMKLKLKKLERPPKALTRAQARAMFNRAARRHFKVKDGQEWLVRYILGEFRDDESLFLLMQVPFAR